MSSSSNKDSIDNAPEAANYSADSGARSSGDTVGGTHSASHSRHHEQSKGQDTLNKASKDDIAHAPESGSACE
ncbi:hypothetical protein HDV00_010519 [Rhizophlyctis rosea]|nr:hypothetical protein HDV00_010519 [Rhizophlyctis rosea]